MGKKGRKDKRKKNVLVELKEEGRGGRRRSRRLAKSNAKRKLKEGALQEELDLEDSGCPKWRMREKVVKFGVGGMEKVEEEILDSYRSYLGE